MEVVVRVIVIEAVSVVAAAVTAMEAVVTALILYGHFHIGFNATPVLYLKAGTVLVYCAAFIRCVLS
jgi:hypothetical protein